MKNEGVTRGATGWKPQGRTVGDACPYGVGQVFQIVGTYIRPLYFG